MINELSNGVKHVNKTLVASAFIQMNEGGVKFPHRDKK